MHDTTQQTPQTDYIKYVPEERTIKRIGKLHVLLYRCTGGLVGSRIDGLDVLLLTTIGRKTGARRTVPMPYFRDGSSYVLVASFGGNDKNPAWLYNVSANPAVEVQLGCRKFRARAKVCEDGERARIWSEITRLFPRYLEYQKKTARTIPLVMLDRV